LFASGGVYHFDVATGSNRYVQALVDYAASNRDAIVGDSGSVNTMSVANHLQNAAHGVFVNAHLEMKRATGGTLPIPQKQEDYVHGAADQKARTIIGPEYKDSAKYEEETDLSMQQFDSKIQGYKTKVNELANMGEEFTAAMDATIRKPLAMELGIAKRDLVALGKKIAVYVAHQHRYGGNLQDDRTVALNRYLKTIKEKIIEVEEAGSILYNLTPHEVQPGSDSTVTDPANNDTSTSERKTRRGTRARTYLGTAGGVDHLNQIRTAD
jgi:hypothetical protein